VDESVAQDCCGGDEESDGLVPAEAVTLEFATGFALLLDGVVLQLVVHAPLARAVLEDLAEV
jgi:hypothetical protein